MRKNNKTYNSIPKSNRPIKDMIPKPELHGATDNGIVFSFEALERTEYFNLDGTCANWASDLLEMCKAISGITVKQLTSGSYRTYRFHSHEGATCPSKLPEGVELKDLYQIRISTSKGGIHGVLRENCFYVIWLDPLHNMYPDNRYGGLRKVKPASTCCRDREDELVLLKEELRKAKKDVQELEELAKEALKMK